MDAFLLEKKNIPSPTVFPAHVGLELGDTIKMVWGGASYTYDRYIPMKMIIYPRP